MGFWAFTHIQNISSRGALINTCWYIIHRLGSSATRTNVEIRKTVQFSNTNSKHNTMVPFSVRRAPTALSGDLKHLLINSTSYDPNVFMLHMLATAGRSYR